MMNSLREEEFRPNKEVQAGQIQDDKVWFNGREKKKKRRPILLKTQIDKNNIKQYS